jgi:hypothetical protein
MTLVHVVAIMTVDLIVTTMTVLYILTMVLDHAVSTVIFDTIAAFLISLVALFTSLSVTWHKSASGILVYLVYYSVSCFPTGGRS